MQAVILFLKQSVIQYIIHFSFKPRLAHTFFVSSFRHFRYGWAQKGLWRHTTRNKESIIKRKSAFFLLGLNNLWEGVNRIWHCMFRHLYICIHQRNELKEKVPFISLFCSERIHFSTIAWIITGLYPNWKQYYLALCYSIYAWGTVHSITWMEFDILSTSTHLEYPVGLM